MFYACFFRVTEKYTQFSVHQQKMIDKVAKIKKPTHKIVLVSLHALRYTPIYACIKEILDKKEIYNIYYRPPLGTYGCYYIFLNKSCTPFFTDRQKTDEYLTY